MKRARIVVLGVIAVFILWGVLPHEYKGMERDVNGKYVWQYPSLEGGPRAAFGFAQSDAMPGGNLGGNIGATGPTGGTGGTGAVGATGPTGPAPTNIAVDVPFSIIGTPVTTEIIPITMVRTLTFGINFGADAPAVAAQAACKSNPAETDDYLIKCNGTQIGDVSLSTSCVATFTTVGGTTKTCAAGQILELDAPATVSGSGVGITLGAYRAYP